MFAAWAMGWRWPARPHHKEWRKFLIFGRTAAEAKRKGTSLWQHVIRSARKGISAFSLAEWQQKRKERRDCLSLTCAAEFAQLSPSFEPAAASPTADEPARHSDSAAPPAPCRVRAASIRLSATHWNHSDLWLGTL